MKNILFVCFCVILMNSCKNKVHEDLQFNQKLDKVFYESYGDSIIPLNIIETPSMVSHYKSMQVGDSMHAKMKAKVTDVCQAKGCWMTLNLEHGNEVMVKFKDYGFFVPKDIAGKEVIVSGKAFVNEVSVEEQRHYAEDAGKTTDDIVSITQPKRTFSFEADGVLIQQ